MFFIEDTHRVISYSNKSATTGHIDNPFSDRLCIAYDPAGPTPKSGSGVMNFSDR